MAELRRVQYINDITPAELAMVFADFHGQQQAEFFDELAAITSAWPGAGWCMQSCAIAEHLTADARKVVETLAGHASDTLQRTGEAK